MLMEYTAMIRRGWPNGAALEHVEPIKAGSTLSNGDWVVNQPDNSVDKSGATASANTLCGLVVSGNGDAASAANSGKAVVLWSNFIADISNYDTVPTYVPGAALMSVSGKLTLQTGTNPTVAYVLNVVAGVAGVETGHLTVLVK